VNEFQQQRGPQCGDSLESFNSYGERKLEVKMKTPPAPCCRHNLQPSSTFTRAAGIASTFSSSASPATCAHWESNPRDTVEFIKNPKNALGIGPDAGNTFQKS
jgi:hypothetical protein